MRVAVGAALLHFVDSRFRLGSVLSVVDHDVAADMPGADGDALANPELAPVTSARCPFSFFSMGQAGITTGGNVGSFISVKSTSFIIDALSDWSRQEQPPPRRYCVSLFRRDDRTNG